MGQTREGSLKCVNCGAANFYECGCYARCRCGHDRRLHMATGTCTVVGCECEHGFHDSAGRPPADTIARLTRERDEARAQVDRLRVVRERVEAERNRLRHEAALFRQDRDDVRAFSKDCAANFAAWVSNQLSEALAAGER